MDVSPFMTLLQRRIQMYGLAKEEEEQGVCWEGSLENRLLTPDLFQGIRSVLLRTPNRVDFLRYLKVCQGLFLLRSQIMSSYHCVPTNYNTARHAAI